MCHIEQFLEGGIFFYTGTINPELNKYSLTEIIGYFVGSLILKVSYLNLSRHHLLQLTKYKPARSYRIPLNKFFHP